MDASKKGSSSERTAIRELLQDDDFTKLVRYQKTWTSMFNSAAGDAQYHCKLIAKTLRKSSFEGVKNLSLPFFRADVDYNLPIPSLAFVVTKILKTLDLKLGNGAREI